MNVTFAGVRFPYERETQWQHPAVKVPVWREITLGQVLESVWEKLQAEGVEPFSEEISLKAEQAWKEYHAAHHGRYDRVPFPDLGNSIEDTDPCPVAVFLFY